MNDRDDLHSLIESDLAAIRVYEPAYDVERGAKRWATSLAVGCATTGVSAGAAATSKGLVASTSAVVPASGLLAKLFGVTALSSLALATAFQSSPGDVQAVLAACSVTTTASAPMLSAPVQAQVSVATSPTQQVVSVPRAASVPPPAPSSSAGSKLQPHAEPRQAARNDGGAAFAKEVVAVAEARDLLARDPEAALRKTNDAASATPLSEERAIIAIRALVSLGRKADARAHAARFVARYPSSPFAPAARALVRDE